MNSTVGNPFLLASYPQPSRVLQGKTGTPRNAPSLLHASHSRLPQSEDGEVTVAAQGDGVHILNLAALHPASSHTLGPSTTYYCAPATSITMEEGKAIRRTYAVLDTAPDVGLQDRGRAIRSWKESLQEDFGAASQETEVFVASHLVSQIYVPEALHSDIILISPEGELTRTNANFDVRNHWTPPIPNVHIIKTFVFPRRACQFVPADKVSSTGILVLSFTLVSDELLLRIFSLGQEGEFLTLDEKKLPIKPENILDVSCDPSGHLSILSLDGLWQPCRIDVRNGQMSISRAADPICLKGLSFISQDHSAVSQNASVQVSLLSLGSSHVLLAAIAAPPNPEIVLLLWDVQYAVLLDSHVLPIPSTLQNLSAPEIALSLVPGSSSQALLVLHPLTSSQKSRSQSKAKAGSSQLRSSVFVVPFSIPPTSTIANAMGRASQGTKWLAGDGNSYNEGMGNALFDSARMELLQKMQEALAENRPEDADVAFFDWVERETGKHQTRKLDVQGEDRIGEVGVGAKMNDPSRYREDGDKWKPHAETKKFLGHAFTARVVKLILQPRKAENAPYSSKILHYLMEKQVVSNIMIDGGLLAALSAHNDWDLIHMALRKVIDIPESDILQMLHIITRAHRRQVTIPASVNPDAMAVDQPTTTSKPPTLPAFLAACLLYPVSATALRIALRLHFTDAEDLMCLLEVLERWIVQWSAKDLKLTFDDVVINEHGVTMNKPKNNKKMHRRVGKESLPKLEDILSFLKAILDSSFLTLLQYTPSHKILKNVLMHLEPQIALTEELELLRGTLEPFARAQAKALADGRGGRKKDLEVDWRRRRKQVHEQAGIAIGLYQVEELVF